MLQCCPGLYLSLPQSVIYGAPSFLTPSLQFLAVFPVHSLHHTCVSRRISQVNQCELGKPQKNVGGMGGAEEAATPEKEPKGKAGASSGSGKKQSAGKRSTGKSPPRR